MLRISAITLHNFQRIVLEFVTNSNDDCTEELGRKEIILEIYVSETVLAD